MRSASKGGGQFFWATAKEARFGPTRRLGFDAVHDGEWHDYEVKLAAADDLSSIRLDPSAATGIIEVDWLRLIKPDGAVLKAWEFGPPNP